MPRTLSALLIAAALALPAVAAADGCPVTAGPKAKAAAAVVAGQTITVGALDTRIADQLCKARVELARKEAELRQQALDQLIAERLLEAEAKARKLAGVEALIDAEVVQPVSAPAEAEIRAFYEQNQARMGGATFEQVSPQIAQHLTQQARQSRFEALVEGLREKAKVKVTLEPFRLPVEAKGPSRGPASAPVTIVSFADYECPYCARAAESLEAARAQFGDRVRVVFRDFPLEFHQNAVPAAIAARCAGAQGKYWAMHDKLFEDQRALDPPSLKAHAAAIGLDAAKFDACFADPQHLAAIAADQEAGKKLGVEGTPAFFVNGIPMSGAQPTEAFVAAIEAELARKKK